MILRVLNLIVIGALILAAAYVYRIKFDSTVQAERLAKIRGELRHERDTIASLRAQWGELDAPARIEELAKHFLPLKPIAPTQFDTLDNLPERPPEIGSDGKDPIRAIIEDATGPQSTGSITRSAAPPPNTNSQAPTPAAPTAAATNPGHTP
jgi:hypothetical protein